MDHNTTAKTAQSLPTHHTRSALAFMQQVLVIGALVASMGWFFWFRDLSIWLATVGALTMLLGYVVVLAVEFVAVARVSRGDVVPAADPGALLEA